MMITQKDYTKCEHYPWVMTDDDCPNCEQHAFKRDGNTFYCIPCGEYTRHRKKYTGKVSCIACNSVKKCVKLQNPNINYEQCFYIVPYNNVSNNFFTNQKCTNCDGSNRVEYTNAYFYCGIDGINSACVDTNRPLCSKCHYRICNKKTHESCEHNFKFYKVTI